MSEKIWPRCAMMSGKTSNVSGSLLVPYAKFRIWKHTTIVKKMKSVQAV
jgi:hypothetical protein